MTTRININGIIEEEAHISVFDHGFLFGDSIYEVIATKNNLPCFLSEHLKRLHRSAKGIDLDRKVLADMAMNEPDSFAELAKAVIS